MAMAAPTAMITPAITSMTTTMTEARYRLMTWLSPAYPIGAFSYSQVLSLPSGPVALRAALLRSAHAFPTGGGTVAVYRQAGALLASPATEQIRTNLVALMREIAGASIKPATDSRGRVGLSFPDPAVFGSSIPIASSLVVDPSTARPLERRIHQEAAAGKPEIGRDTYLTFSTQPPPAPYDR